MVALFASHHEQQAVALLEYVGRPKMYGGLPNSPMVCQ